jgi:hypothetical protein
LLSVLREAGMIAPAPLPPITPEDQIFGKRRLDDIGFPIDAGGFSGACGKHHLQQRLQYLLQSFAAVLAGGLRIEAGYVAAAARSTLKFHGSS